jgi:acyl dehydratase
MATVRELDAAPNLMGLFGRAVLAELAEPRTHDQADRGLPGTEYLRSHIQVDRENLAAYDRVCGFRLSDQLPATYPHILAFPLQAKLMSDDDFPLGMVGMVHVANRITQVRPLLASEPLSLRVYARDLRPHHRGKQFDMVSEGLVDGEVVWTDVSTYLRRGRPSGSPEPDRAPVASASPGAPLGPPGAVWRVGADFGRRYAAVSGDHNPIHLHPLSARLFGFKRAIVHGMWSKARCLAAFEGRLPAAFTIDVRFKLPIMLPSMIALRASPDGDGGWRFDLRAERDGKPHLTGSITRAS